MGALTDIQAMRLSIKGKIRTALEALATYIDAAEESSAIGTLSSLTTTVKTSLVAALNELDGEHGTISSLTTTAKNTFVAAINELDGDIGALASLTTTVKTSLMAAINELDADVGALSGLTTTVKTSLVAAINELDGELNNLTAVLVTDNLAVTAAMNGKTFIVTADAKTMSLPATALGLRYKFVNGGADGAIALTISPVSADKIMGNISASAGGAADATTADGLVCKSGAVDNKDWINTKATANQGDWCELTGDGADGWFITGGVGIWASEAP